MIDIGPLDGRIDLATGRSLPTCRHMNAEPVRLLDGGELVAWLCPDCDEQLPPDPDPLLWFVTTGALPPDDARRLRQ